MIVDVVLVVLALSCVTVVAWAFWTTRKCTITSTPRPWWERTPPRTWAERMEREATGQTPMHLGPATRPPRTYRELRALSDEELMDLADEAMQRERAR